MEPVVGIDLGTTNSEVAYIINKNAEILKDNDNGILPSCVGLNNDDKIIVGHEARNQAIIAPERTVLSIKRLMGKDEKILLGGVGYLPQEISAFILKALKERAEKALNQKISNAVITVPAYFTDAQRLATREAGEIAGLNVVRIINEPTAAALAYESTGAGKQTVLIFDLGGGTFDVSIVKIENGIVEVLASTGDNQLGGDDFDIKILNKLKDHIKNELKLDISNNTKVLARLRRAAENAKIELSSKPYTIIEEDHIGKKTFKSIHLSYEFSRTDFEKLIEDDLLRTMDSVNNALHDANLSPSKIDKIILVGGSTRIPEISKMLERKFNILPHSEIDPDLCVAIGAAIQAGREMGKEDISSILLDITPYTFGTSALGELHGVPTVSMFVPIIRRNTKLPAIKSEAFYTVYDKQEYVEIKIYQGEKPDALDNILIGEYHFKLSKLPANSVIILKYSLDLNGILKIEAVEKETGRKINATIENAFAGFSEEEMAKSRKKIDSAWGAEDKISTEENNNNISQDIPADINEVILEAQSKLNEASEEDREDMINLIEDIKDAISNNNIKDAEKAKSELEEILLYIG